MDNIKVKTFNSVKWTVGRNFTASIVSFLFTLILARLLTPEDFGVVAVANAFISFGLVFAKMGLGPALIQKKVIQSEEISACFTSSFFLGILIYLLVIVNIHHLSNLFQMNSLDKIIKVLSITFVLQSIVIPGTSILERNLDYKFLSKVELFAQVVFRSCLTLILAYLGLGVWSIVIGILSAQLIVTIILFMKNRQYIKFNFKKAAYIEIYKYSLKYSGIQLLDYLYGNMNTLFVGKLYGASITGLFDRSAAVVRLPISNIVVGVNRVMFPVFSRMQGQISESSNMFFKNLFMLGTSCSIIAGGLAAISEEIIPLVLGNQWLAVITPFKFICIFVCFEYLASIMFSPLDSNNRLRDRMIFKLIPLVIRLIIYYIAFLRQTEFINFLLLISCVEILYFILYLKRTAKLFQLETKKLLIINLMQFFFISFTFIILTVMKKGLIFISLPNEVIVLIAPFIMFLFFSLNISIAKYLGYLDFGMRNILALLLKRNN